MNTFFNAIGKKLSILLLVIIGGLLLSGCNGSEETIPDNYYGTLLSERKTVTISDLNYDEDSDHSIDYSDDTRELIDVSSLTDDDVITIPSTTFETALRDYLQIEGDITYGDLRYVERLNLMYFQDLDSIAGIEYFESLTYLNIDYTDVVSINGIQTLEQLDKVSVDHTNVRKIDYPTANVGSYSANYTLVDYSSQEIIDMFEGNQNLWRINLRNTKVKGTKALYDYTQASVETSRIKFVDIDYKQIDFDTLGYRSFWKFDDGFWQNHFLLAYLKTADDFSINGPYDTFYIDITDDDEWDIISQYFNTWIEDIGLEYTDNELEKILLVYDYFLEHITIDEEGSFYIKDALEEEPVTLATAYETLALFYWYIDIPTYTALFESGQYGGTWDGEFNSRHLLIVYYNRQRYVIHFREGITYEYFMIGQPQIPAIYLENAHFLSMFKEVSSYDLSRDAIEAAAQALNIDLTYE